MLTNNVRQILEKEVHVSPGQAGGRKSSNIEEVLANNQKKALWALYAAAIMVIVFFIIMILLLLNNIHDPTLFSIISSASGVSIGGLIYILIRISKEITQTNLLLVLVKGLPPQDLRDIYLALLANRERRG